MDWLEQLKLESGFGGKSIDDIGWLSLAAVEALSLLSALFVAYLYVRFFEHRGTGSKIYRAFPLIGISVTTIFVTIQFSLPLSLGLLGALSIVRFRTPIKEPEEIGFILVVIASGLCCATFNLLLLAIFLSTAVAALFILRGARWITSTRASEGVFVVTLPRDQYAESSGAIIQLLDRSLPNGKMESITESDTDSTISYGFARMQNQPLLELSQELRRLADGAKTSIFYAP